jgi:hypothetical protein
MNRSKRKGVGLMPRLFSAYLTYAGLKSSVHRMCGWVMRPVGRIGAGTKGRGG